MRDLDVRVIDAGTCHAFDVKAGIRGGKVVETLGAESSSELESVQRLGATLELVDVKARVRAGRSVTAGDGLGALVSVSAGDSIVRTPDAASLQLIDVKAHVLGGFA